MQSAHSNSSLRTSSNALTSNSDIAQSENQARSQCESTLTVTQGHNNYSVAVPHSEPEPIIVDWDGPNDPTNPRNWTQKKKWLAAATVSAFTLISPISSSMVAPAAEQIAQDFGITSSIEISLTISVFVLGYAVGPLFLGPLSEIYGRVWILRGANLWYTAWNLGCGFAQNKGELIVFRFLAGIGGSAPLASGGAVMSDMWPPEQRGEAIAIYSLAPLLGPVIGPVAGGWISERSTWRWVFWSTTIAAALIQVMGAFLLQETYAPVLLKHKAKRLEKQQDLEKGEKRPIKTALSTDKTFKQVLKIALTRPFILFAREPIIQLVCIYLAFIYGVIYLVLTTIPDVFADIYHESVGIAGLHYIALGIGLLIAAQANARLLDRIYISAKARNGGVGQPEFRLPTVFPGTICIPVGLLMCGWGAEKHAHWIVFDIGLALIGAGIVVTFQGMQSYTIDAFTQYAASALAAVSCLRSLAGFGFPLFAPYMYNALGYGVGNTILAAFSVVVGPPATFIFWRYGEKIRGMSRYTHKAPLAPARKMSVAEEPEREQIQEKPLDTETQDSNATNSNSP